MNVPESTLEKIGSQFHTDRERKTEVLRVCSTEHPQPTWEQVSNALYQSRDEKYHNVLERVQSQFPTGEYLSVTSHTSHRNLPLPLLIVIVHVTCHVHVHTSMYTCIYMYCILFHVFVAPFDTCTCIWVWSCV